MPSIKQKKPIDAIITSLQLYQKKQQSRWVNAADTKDRIIFVGKLIEKLQALENDSANAQLKQGVRHYILNAPFYASSINQPITLSERWGITTALQTTSSSTSTALIQQTKPMHWPTSFFFSDVYAKGHLPGLLARAFDLVASTQERKSLSSMKVSFFVQMTKSLVLSNGQTVTVPTLYFSGNVLKRLTLPSNQKLKNVAEIAYKKLNIQNPSSDVKVLDGGEENAHTTVLTENFNAEATAALKSKNLGKLISVCSQKAALSENRTPVQEVMTLIEGAWLKSKNPATKAEALKLLYIISFSNIPRQNNIASRVLARHLIQLINPKPSFASWDEPVVLAVESESIQTLSSGKEPLSTALTAEGSQLTCLSADDLITATGAVSAQNSNSVNRSAAYLYLLSSLRSIVSPDENHAKPDYTNTVEGLVFLYKLDGIDKLPKELIDVLEALIKGNEGDAIASDTRLKGLHLLTLHYANKFSEALINKKTLGGPSSSTRFDTAGFYLLEAMKWAYMAFSISSSATMSPYADIMMSGEPEPGSCIPIGSWKSYQAQCGKVLEKFSALKNQKGLGPYDYIYISSCAFVYRALRFELASDDSKNAANVFVKMIEKQHPNFFAKYILSAEGMLGGVNTALENYKDVSYCHLDDSNASNPYDAKSTFDQAIFTYRGDTPEMLFLSRILSMKHDVSFAECYSDAEKDVKVLKLETDSSEVDIARAIKALALNIDDKDMKNFTKIMAGKLMPKQASLTP